MVRTRALHAGFGVEVSGIDLAQVAAERGYAEIRDLVRPPAA